MSNPLSTQLALFDTNIKTLAELVVNRNDGERVNITESTPYFTNRKIDGKRIMAVMLDFGTLPNNATKAMAVPSSVITNRDSATTMWLNVGRCYAVNSTTNEVVPLPYSAQTYWSDQIELRIQNDSILLTTKKNMSSFSASITIEYIEALS